MNVKRKGYLCFKASVVARVRTRAARQAGTPVLLIKSSPDRFEDDYQSGSRESVQLIDSLAKQVAEWGRAWDQDDSPPPALMVAELSEEVFYLIDTRREDRPRVRFLDSRQTKATLVEGPLDDEYSVWAMNEGFAVALDGRSIPLATASHDLLKKFETDDHA